MNTLDAHNVRLAVITRDLKVTVFTKRALVLGDLIPLWEIGIEVIFSGKPGIPVNIAVKGEAGTNGILHSFSIQDRE
jgi:hypothetical protein